MVTKSQHIGTGKWGGCLHKGWVTGDADYWLGLIVLAREGVTR
jgi:hypothetical protein